MKETIRMEKEIGKSWSIGLTSLMAAIMIVSLFSGIASAETGVGNTAVDETTVATGGDTSVTPTANTVTPKQERTIQEKYEKAKDQYLKQKDRYENARERFNTAEEKFQEARKKFRAARDAASREELKVRTKEYLERAADQMISHLEVMKTRVENADRLPVDAAANIDEHIAAIEDIKADIQQAETAKEITDAARKLREEWIKIRLETRYYAGLLINQKIDAFLSKSDDVTAKMDEVIAKLNAEGIDTSKLEEKASNFNNMVSKAEDTNQRVADLYETHQGFDSNGMVTDIAEAREFLNEAQDLQKDIHKDLKTAINEVRQFFKEAKKLVNRVVVSGTGTLEASGNGRAVIEGDVTVTLSEIDGTLIVSGTADVATDGEGTREELGNGDIKYQGFGSATITGDNIRVEISGNNIDLKATGTGSAVLSGQGTYKTERGFGVSGEWDMED